MFSTTTTTTKVGPLNPHTCGRPGATFPPMYTRYHILSGHGRILRKLAELWAQIEYVCPKRFGRERSELAAAGHRPRPRPANYVPSLQYLVFSTWSRNYPAGLVVQ